ncbi:hypothetical protein BDP27DRAFT_1179924, partial [Rhodocollybia butyracea]
PASFKAQDLEHVLALCDSDYDDYELEVAHLQSRILYTRQQQQMLKDHKVRLRSLNSPVRKIPNEILANIFDLACERNFLLGYPWRDVNEPPIPSLMPSLPALSIASTCVRWRSVAVSTPSLWSRL